MNLQSYGPSISAFLSFIWAVWLDQEFKQRNERRFREIAPIKLLVKAQATLQSFLFNHTLYHHTRTEPIIRLFSTQILGGEPATRGRPIWIVGLGTIDNLLNFVTSTMSLIDLIHPTDNYVYLFVCFLKK